MLAAVFVSITGHCDFSFDRLNLPEVVLNVIAIVLVRFVIASCFSLYLNYQCTTVILAIKPIIIMIIIFLPPPHRSPSIFSCSIVAR